MAVQSCAYPPCGETFEPVTLGGNRKRYCTHTCRTRHRPAVPRDHLWAPSTPVPDTHPSRSTAIPDTHPCRLVKCGWEPCPVMFVATVSRYQGKPNRYCTYEHSRRAGVLAWQKRRRARLGRCAGCGERISNLHTRCASWCGVTACHVPDEHPSRSTPVPESHPARRGTCQYCAEDFLAVFWEERSAGGRFARLNKYCSRSCGSKAARLVRRAAKAESNESVSIIELRRRDGDVCGLCDHPLDMTLTAGRSRPTLDHVIPVSRGGTHGPANLQLAHMGCNSRKGNRMTLADVRRRLQLERRYRPA